MERAQIGVAVLIKDEKGRVLLSIRNGTQKGTFAPPGGHLHKGELITTCAVRKVKEETNLKIVNLERLAVVEDVEDGYVVHFIGATAVNPSELQNTQPLKHEDWKWFGAEEMSKLPLFSSLRKLTLATLLWKMNMEPEKIIWV